MRWNMGARLGAMALGLALCGAARSAVMTADIQITGTGPFTITYYLAQQTATMKVKIFSDSGTLVRTIDVTDPAQTSPGMHDATSGVTWDGKTDGGTDATPGLYYAQIDTTGDPVTIITLIAGPKSFKAAPGKTEARTAYGGAVNKDVNSPYHNLGYFGVGPTNSNGGASSGVEVVRPDASSTIFPLDGKPSSYDYVAASLLDDGTILAAGQGLAGAGTKQMLTLSPLDGTVLGTWGKGFLDVRTIQAFGNAPNATVYIVDDVVGGINKITTLDVKSADDVKNIIPNDAFPAFAQRALVVNRAQTSIWVSGGTSGTAAGPIGAGFVAKFDFANGAWTQDSAFVPLDPNGLPPSGNLRGLTLSPDESTLWITTNSSSHPEADMVYAVDAKTGANKGVEYAYLDWMDGSFTPQGITSSAGDANHNANTSYNLFVAGYRSVSGAISTANGVALLAPPDNGSSDSTRSQRFEVVGSATGVTVTGGPTVSDITDTTATITWTTDFLSDSSVQLGTSAGNYTLPATSKTAMVTNHVINLENLAPGTTYYFQVVSNKSPLNPGTKAGSFTTTPNLAVTSETLTTTTTSATLNFDTNVASAATVTWGETRDALTKPAINVASGTSHSATFNGLAAGKTYYYQVALTSPNANPFTSVVSTFATAADGGTDATRTFSDFSLDQKTGLVNNGAAVELPHQGIPTFPQPGPALLAPLYFGGATAYNGYLYLVGGTDGGGTAQSLVTYAKINADGTLDATFGGGTGWQVASNLLPAPRTELANSVFAYNGYLYAVGGSDGTAAQTTVLYAPLDPTTGDVGAWKGLEADGTTATNPMPKTVTRGGARVVDGNVVVSGGAQGGAVASSDYIAGIRPDGSLGPWQTTAPAYRNIWDQTLLGNAHTLYSVGGEAGIKLNSVDVAMVQPNGDLTKVLPATNYPGHTDSTMPNVTAAAAAGIAGGKIITAGGAFNEIISGNVQGTTNVLYSKILDDKLPGPWVKAGTDDPSAVLPNDAANLTGAAYNNVFYAIGGRGKVSLYAGGTTSDTAIGDVSIFQLNPDPLDTGYAAYGTLESKVVDLGSLTNLQRLTVAGASVSASTVSVRYRFANADGVFTDWYDLSGVDAAITGGARYFQYQVVLKGSASVTPSVTSVVLKTGAAVTPPDKFADVRNALRIAGGLQAATGADKTKLDVDANGRIDVVDAVRLARQVQ